MNNNAINNNQILIQLPLHKTTNNKDNIPLYPIYIPPPIPPVYNDHFLPLQIAPTLLHIPLNQNNIENIIEPQHEIPI